MLHACFCRWVVFRGITGINSLIIGAVRAWCKNAPKVPYKTCGMWPSLMGHNKKRWAHGMGTLDDNGGALSAVRAQCNYLGVWPY